MLSHKKNKIIEKYHRGRMPWYTKLVRNELCFGNFGLTKHKSQIWINVTSNRSCSSNNQHVIQNVVLNCGFEFFPDKTVTARAAESRMGVR
nr:hypothetical protein DMDDKFKA_00166 [Haslea ostrearia]